MTLLQKVVQVLPIAQRLAVKKLLSQHKKAGAIRTSREELKEANRLLEEIKGKVGKQIFSPRYAVPENVISSADHNSNMEAIFVDLSAIYSELDSIGTATATKTAALQSDYLKSRVAVEKLLNDARTFSLRRKYQEFSEIYIIDFNSSRNVTKATPKAQIDPKTRLLELTLITSTRAHLENRAERVTRVYTKTVGPGLKGELTTNLPPEGMIDQKPETFWGTLVMTDTPTQQTYLRSDATEITVNGPIVEVYLRYSHLEQLNVVRVLPFGEYPLSVIDVSYRPNSTSEVFYPVREFQAETTLDWVEINFPRVFASELKISILQENPKQTIYHLPKSMVVNTDIFDHILRGRRQQIVGSLFFDSDLAQQLLKKQDAYQEALSDLADIVGQSDLLKGPLDDIQLNLDLRASLGLVFGELDKAQSQELIETDLVEVQEDEDVVEVRKYEYILGVREIETAYEMFAPTCFFESETYLPQATLSNVLIEVDDERLRSRNSWGPFYENSVEWSIDVGEGRVLPIHPINFTGIFSTPAVEDERLQFDRSTTVAYTRLGAATNDVLALRRNGQIVPKTGYLATRQTGVVPKIKVQLYDNFWDEDSIYTIDYEVSPDSYDVDLLTRLDPRDLGEPEIKTTMGPDNDVVLTKYPFILYEVINRTGQFTKESEEAKWTYKPPTPNVASGQLQITPTVLNSLNQTLVTGSITGTFVTGSWGNQSGVAGPHTNDLNATYFNNPENFAYYVQAQGVRRNFEVSGVSAPDKLLFFEPPTFTLAQLQEMPSTATTGIDLTGSYLGYIEAEYVLGVGINIGGQIFAFDNSLYEPISVTVGGQPAKNITDYVELEHPAFSIANNSDREYEYVHAGRRLYFNQQVNDIEIRISYQWLTEHIKVLGTLRCNKALNPDITPKIDEIRLLMNTSIL